MVITKYFVSLLTCVGLMAFSTRAADGITPIRARIDLQGEWRFQLDSLNRGIAENWATLDFQDVVSLPGTTDTNRKGYLNTNMDETTHLSRVYSYVGKAWYKRQIDVPEQWKDKTIRMVLERTKPTMVWIDGQKVGANDNISTSQIYDLTPFLSVGKHEVTIMVDNGESVPPQLLSNSHAYTESTQTNWNGIIGDMYVESMDNFHIKDIQVYPDTEKKIAHVKIRFSKPNNIRKADVILKADSWNSEKRHSAASAIYNVDLLKDEFEIDYPLGDDALLWSEFHPSLYRLNITLKGKKIHDEQSVDFGLRNFESQGSHFTINDNITFLRGKHDACVFPLTAHTAMDVDSWLNYFRTAKQYGINHYRFHSWCPPRACFQAADIEGVYLQPELPFWGTFDKTDKRLISYLGKEGINIQNEYGNHASFVMFALGNEIFGDQEVMDTLVSTFRNIDNRHLYAFGANNYLGYNGQVAGEDFLVTCRIGGAAEKSFDTHTRASFSFADAYDGGYINHMYPNLSMNFTDAIKGCTVPIVGHETGQFQIYPNYNEIEKYTGVLQPRNFEVFRQRLISAGMIDQAYDFFRASGKFAVILYRADIEMNFRTPNIGGFQLLDLQDYPGQGSAFVGILDAFMDSKGLISPMEWRNFCSPVVPLLIVDKFCWTNAEVLNGEVKIANYSENSFVGNSLEWVLSDNEGKNITNGSFEIKETKSGLLDLGNITLNLGSITGAQKVSLTLYIPGTEYQNTYRLWIYPSQVSIESPQDIIITDKLDDTTKNALKQGGKVLWFPNRSEVEKSTVGGLFQTDYWNYRMFRTICENNKKTVSPGTLGILTNPTNPIFNEFPTEFHSNWQWFPIVKNSYPLILDKMPSDYRPIVQVIDNIERNHKLGLIFEFGVENGKLLICMANLSAVIDKPEVRQLYKSMISYMQSDDFKPATSLNIEELERLFNDEVTGRRIELLENISYQ